VVTEKPLAGVRGMIVDMDGVLWHGEAALSGLTDFFRVLRERSIPFILMTNNSSKKPDEYVAKLERMGVRVSAEEILTCAEATAQYLATSAPEGTRVFVIGEEGLIHAITHRKFTLLAAYESGAQFVVCGMDSGISWDKLATATINLRGGAKLVGTNPDAAFPTERGIVHGNGAILAALQTASGVTPVIVGKPEPYMYREAISRLGIDSNEIVAVGDRLETDILGAVRAGIRSLLILSGVSTTDELAALDYQPTWVMKDLSELTDAIA